MLGISVGMNYRSSPMGHYAPSLSKKFEDDDTSPIAPAAQQCSDNESSMNVETKTTVVRRKKNGNVEQKKPRSHKACVREQRYRQRVRDLFNQLAAELGVEGSTGSEASRKRVLQMAIETLKSVGAAANSMDSSQVDSDTFDSSSSSSSSSSQEQPSTDVALVPVARHRYGAAVGSIPCGDAFIQSLLTLNVPSMISERSNQFRFDSSQCGQMVFGQGGIVFHIDSNMRVLMGIPSELSVSGRAFREVFEVANVALQEEAGKGRGLGIEALKEVVGAVRQGTRSMAIFHVGLSLLGNTAAKRDFRCVVWRFSFNEQQHAYLQAVYEPLSIDCDCVETSSSTDNCASSSSYPAMAGSQAAGTATPMMVAISEGPSSPGDLSAAPASAVSPGFMGPLLSSSVSTSPSFALLSPSTVSDSGSAAAFLVGQLQGLRPER